MSRENLVYHFEDLVNTLPHRLTPRDDLSYQESKVYFSESQMILSPGEWTIHSAMTMDSDNGIYITGSGYHTILKCGPNNTAGAMVVNGDDVVIENVKFSRTTDSTAPAVGNLLSITGQRVTIRNCWFDGSNAQISISANLADDLIVESCVFDGGWGTAIYLKDCDTAMIKNNRVYPGHLARAIFLDCTDKAVPIQRCNDAVIVANHVGSTMIIEYNVSGAHMVAGNNNSANLVAYV